MHFLKVLNTIFFTLFIKITKQNTKTRTENSPQGLSLYAHDKMKLTNNVIKVP